MLLTRREEVIFVGSLLTADERAMPFAVGCDRDDVLRRTCEIGRAGKWAGRRVDVVIVHEFRDGVAAGMPVGYTLDGERLPEE